jgi:hypothetical protein
LRPPGEPAPASVALRRAGHSRMHPGATGVRRVTPERPDCRPDQTPPGVII